jgi:hypothetical protein
MLAAIKSLFWNFSANSSLGHPVKLDDLPWLISDCITLLGISQVQPLKPGHGMFCLPWPTTAKWIILLGKSC